MSSRKLAVITGNTRGIGKRISQQLASQNYNIVVTGKTVEPQKTLDGTIFSVAKELESEYSIEAMPIQCDVREDDQVKAMADQIKSTYGKVDVLINNAGALWWQPILRTPMTKFDLMYEVNARATFHMSRLMIPMMKRDGGHIINMSPPIDFDLIPNKIGYCMSKFGMTMATMGIASEFEGKGILANALWPSTLIESFATKNFAIGDEKNWRKADILSDCVDFLVNQDLKNPVVNGQALIDEDYLREYQNFEDKDFIRYRCHPDFEPEKMQDAFKSIHRSAAKKNVKPKRKDSL